MIGSEALSSKYRNRPTCKACGDRPAKYKGKRANGSPIWARKCKQCQVGGTYSSTPTGRRRNAAYRTRKNRRREVRKRPWLEYRKDHCERCGFVAIDPCQLDVDHIDGCGTNNDPNNYMTLCTNCHRLKTLLNGDHLTSRETETLKDTWKQGELFN